MSSTSTPLPSKEEDLPLLRQHDGKRKNNYYGLEEPVTSTISSNDDDDYVDDEQQQQQQHHQAGPLHDSIILSSDASPGHHQDAMLELNQQVSSSSSRHYYPGVGNVLSASTTSWTESWNHFSNRVWEHVGQIGVLGSISIAVNFLTGPAMLEIPAVYQKCGIIPTTVTILFVGLLAALGSLHMARTISQVPGNSKFDLSVEYSEVFRYMFAAEIDNDDDDDDGDDDDNKKEVKKKDENTKKINGNNLSSNTDKHQQRSHYWFVGTQIVFFACVTCLNISSLVDSAQVFDTLLANIVGSTHALQITPTTAKIMTTATETTIDDTTIPPQMVGTSNTDGGWFHHVQWTYASCTSEELLQGQCIPFEEQGDGDDDGVILTAGYLFNILCFLPLSLMNLQENAAWQVVEFVVLIVTSTIFSYLFYQNGLVWGDDDGGAGAGQRLTWWGESWDGLMGVILFNFALVISIASWLYEKEPTVDVRKVIIGSTVLSAFLYIVLGILGALSIPQVSENMLESFMSGALGTSMQVTASIFALFIVGLGIPLLCVLCRLNLTGSGMSHFTANLWSVYFPFGISWLLYRGELVTKLLSWGGVLCTSLIAFIFPLLLALQALRVRHRRRRHQRDGDGRGRGRHDDSSVETNTTTIIVYSRKWEETATDQSERRALHILLFISILSIAMAILGNLLQ